MTLTRKEKIGLLVVGIGIPFGFFLCWLLNSGWPFLLVAGSITAANVLNHLSWKDAHPQGNMVDYVSELYSDD